MCFVNYLRGMTLDPILNCGRWAERDLIAKIKSENDLTTSQEQRECIDETSDKRGETSDKRGDGFGGRNDDIFGTGFRFG
jgi:hypothetical protein